MNTYPSTVSQRDGWIVERRGPKAAVNSREPYAFLVEAERNETGELVDVATLFLTNRECPWRCLMCDLWQNTLDITVEPGDIPAQIEFALSKMPPARSIKLYNSGSFFDPRAIPLCDYPAIAKLVQHFEQVVVECHPSLINDKVLRFADLLNCPLEIAMGLETVHLPTLEKLNKRISLLQFARAAEFLHQHRISLRTFILVRPPFQSEEEGVFWAQRSLDFSFECRAAVSCLIPTRSGNGAMETLAREGAFTEPQLVSVEKCHEYGINQKQGRVFADLWDLERFSSCPECFAPRRQRLDLMNKTQLVLPTVNCSACLSDEKL